MTIRRQLLTAILLAGVPLVVLHASTIVYQYGSGKRLILERDMEVAQTTASLMEVGVMNLVEHHQTVGRFIAQEPRRRREALESIRRSSPLVVRAAYFRPDGRGKFLDPGVPPKATADISDRPYFQALVQGRDWAVSDLLISRTTGHPAVIVAIAVRHQDGSLGGVLVSTMRPEAFARLLHFKAEEGAYVGIVDRTGRVIASNLHQDLPWEKRDWSKKPGVGNALAGMATTVERFVHPWEDTPLMGAWAPVPALGWAVGVMRDLDHEMQPVQRAGVVQLGSLAAVVLLSLVMAVKLAGRLSRPIAGLAEAARKLGEGDLAQRVEVKGTSEVSALGEAFNRMAEDIGSSQVALTKQADELKRRTLELQGLYAQTREDAEAKALLVRELDHRVRNNLATIIALLSMELGRKRHWTADEALQVCIDRVQSLADIHDLLAQDGFGELDLKRLVEAVARAAVKGFSSEEHVEISVEAPPIRLPSRCLFALALTVNELMANALKHAFRGRDGGWIEIRARDEGEEMQLEVRDNGVGIPVVVEEGRRRSVGLEIVTSLVQTDLRGEFRLRNDGGTVATVRFPKPDFEG